jgi:hypothetical protein
MVAPANATDALSSAPSGFAPTRCLPPPGVGWTSGYGAPGIDLKGGSTTLCRQHHWAKGARASHRPGRSKLVSRARHATWHPAIGGDFQTLGQPVTITSKMLFDPGETKTLMPYRSGSGAFLLSVAVIHARTGSLSLQPAEGRMVGYGM